MRVFILLIIVAVFITPASAWAGEPDFWPEVAHPGVKRYGVALKRARGLLSRLQGMRRALTRLSSAERTRRIAGQASVVRGLRRDVLAAAREAIAAAPQHAEAYVVVAKIAYGAEQYQQFIAAVEKARQRSKAVRNDHILAFEMGIAYSKLGDFRHSVREYDRLERILWRSGASSSVRGTAHGNAAETLMALGRLDEAIERYRSAVAYESDPLLYWGLGVALDRDEQVSKSRDALRKAMGKDGRGMRHLGRAGVFFIPKGDVHYYRAVGYLAIRKSGEARKSFELFLKHVPKSQWAYRARAHVAVLKQGKTRHKKRRSLAPRPQSKRSKEDLIARDRRNFVQGVRGEYYSLRRCYKALLVSGKRRVKAAGVVRVALTVGKNGRASSVSIVSSTLRQRAITECVVKRLRRRYYGRPLSKQPVRLVVPIRFDPS
ncbi:MAG: AgmX/PglI C-terminal domain-containing protein [Deltaproteobacteria bacterium]|nr:AgmX/PglI C-terminal domain-containing protein [Deltaproteobacteria bacterium]